MVSKHAIQRACKLPRGFVDRPAPPGAEPALRQLVERAPCRPGLHKLAPAQVILAGQMFARLPDRHVGHSFDDPLKVRLADIKQAGFRKLQLRAEIAATS